MSSYSWWHSRHVRAALIFLVAILMRLPFRATYLVNWDAVNFALGVESFSLEHHQPHPPGYLGYVLFGRLTNWVVGDPVLALTLISVVSGALATMCIYLLAARMVGERPALIAAALFGTSPLVWYYSEVALTYIVEVALVLPLIWLCLEARTRRSTLALVMATVLLAVMGALRQTSLVLLLPVWLYTLWAFSPRTRWINGALLAGLTLAWMVPLLILSGGPVAYLRLSMQLAQLTGGATWLGAGMGTLQNIAIVTTGLILGLHVALLAIPLSALRRSEVTRFPREQRLLLLAWALPPLVIYLFLHTGQLGYVLILLPIGIIWTAKVFDRVTDGSLRWVVVASALVATNVAGFAVLPEIAYAGVRNGQVALPERMAAEGLIESGIRQVSIPRSDAHWDALIAWAEEHDHETTAILAEPRDGGSFRHLAFYLPDYRVYGIGLDRDQSLGHLFTGVEGDTNYSVAALDNASPRLRLPAEVDTLLVPDERLQRRLANTLDFSYDSLPDGNQIAVARVTPGSTLLFLGSAGTPLLTSWALGDAVTAQSLVDARSDLGSLTCGGVPFHTTTPVDAGETVPC